MAKTLRKYGKVASQCAECGARYRKRVDRVMSPDFCCLSCRMVYAKRLRDQRSRACDVCGTTFIPRPNQLSRGQGKFCSMKCNSMSSASRLNTPEIKRLAREGWNRSTARERMRQNVGPKNPSWKGGRYETSGYAWIRESGTGRTTAEHRVVMEKYLGRRLGKDEVVHHKNGNKLDNRLENLELMTRSEHTRLHQEELRQGLRKWLSP